MSWAYVILGHSDCVTQFTLSALITPFCRETCTVAHLLASLQQPGYTSQSLHVILREALNIY